MSAEVRIQLSNPQHDILESDSQVNLFLAGQGSGKTEVAGIVTANLIQSFPKAHGFIGANTYTQLSDSTLFRIRKVWKKFGWNEYSKEDKTGVYVVDVQPPASFNTKDHEYDSYHGKICFKWGTVIYKGSLDNYKAHDGKEFAWAILDETKDTREEAVKEVITGRLREPGMTNSLGEPWNPLYIFTSPAKVQWLNEWFKLDEYSSEITRLIYSGETYFNKAVGNKFTVISSTYHNEPNLPSNYIENQKANLHTALQDMLIYGNPFSQSGGEFYKCFNRAVHVTRTEAIYNPSLPLHLSFDFNVNPYITLTIYQVVGKKLYQVDEMCLSNPNNTTPAVCQEFTRRYMSHVAGVFVYGDPSGRQQDTRSEKGSNDFTLILKHLSQFRPSLRVANAAPPVAMRGNFINTVFEKNFEGIEVLINERCVHSINDFNYLKEASDGTKLKEKVKNPDTGVTYEKYGHCSDSFDYMITQVFAGEFARYQKGGVGGQVITGRNVSKSSY